MVGKKPDPLTCIVEDPTTTLAEKARKPWLYMNGIACGDECRVSHTSQDRPARPPGQAPSFSSTPAENAA